MPGVVLTVTPQWPTSDQGARTDPRVSLALLPAPHPQGMVRSHAGRADSQWPHRLDGKGPQTFIFTARCQVVPLPSVLTAHLEHGAGAGMRDSACAVSSASSYRLCPLPTDRHPILHSTVGRVPGAIGCGETCCSGYDPKRRPVQLNTQGCPHANPHLHVHARMKLDMEAAGAHACRAPWEGDTCGARTSERLSREQQTDCYHFLPKPSLVPGQC